MSDQTRMVSLIEVALSTAIGFVVSALAWPFIAWVMGYPYSLNHTLAVTSFYTVLSIVRGYVVRRFFARGLHQMALKAAKGVLDGNR